MVTKITETLFDLMLAGDMKNYFIQLFNIYMPYGMFFWMFGFTLFLITHMKTKEFLYSGAVATVYFMVIPSTGLVVNAYSVVAMRWFGLALGVLVGTHAYKILRG